MAAAEAASPAAELLRPDAILTLKRDVKLPKDSEGAAVLGYTAVGKALNFVTKKCVRESKVSDFSRRSYDAKVFLWQLDENFGFPNEPRPTCLETKNETTSYRLSMRCELRYEASDTDRVLRGGRELGGIGWGRLFGASDDASVSDSHVAREGIEFPIRSVGTNTMAKLFCQIRSPLLNEQHMELDGIKGLVNIESDHGHYWIKSVLYAMSTDAYVSRAALIGALEGAFKISNNAVLDTEPVDF